MVTIYEGAAADGMNEKGLVANLLYLAESKYPAALLDRLLDHAHIVQISGDSYRLKDKRKAGSLRTPEAA